MTTVTGTVTAPAVDSSHTEPANPYSGGTIASGAEKTIQLDHYQNTGNVSQTVAHEGATNIVGCTVQSVKWVKATVEQTGTSITLTQNEKASLRIRIRGNDLNPGDSDQPFSFDVVTTWS